MVSRWAIFGGSDPWMCLTTSRLVCFGISHWARISVLVYLSPLAPQAFWSPVFIPPRSGSPPVESSNLGSPAIRGNSFHYPLTDGLPLIMVFSLILASPMASITPNWLCSSGLNSALLFLVGVMGSSRYGVIYLPKFSLRRLAAFEILYLLRLSCHRTRL